MLNRMRKSQAKKSFRGFTDHIARFSDRPPSDDLPFELFSGLWSSDVPGIEGTGQFRGFEDDRIKWMLDELKSIEGFSVLELGPLEAAHTYMLEQAGADVLAIEANYGAFLRCLVVKNYMNMRSKFQLGDFQSLDWEQDRYDLVLASGVLYHMTDPVGLLEELSKHTDRLMLWTHCFDTDFDAWSPNARKQLDKGKWDTKNVVTGQSGSFKVRMVRQSYGEALGWNGFCGGPEEFSYWIYREDLIGLLGHLGFQKIDVSFDEKGHQNGPCLAILAQR